MNTPWRIEMLGWMRAQSGDLTVTRFRTQKSALLLARLALSPQRTHPREELIDLLWPDADQDAGRNNLKQSLAILRRILEPPGTPAGGVLIAGRGVVRLNPATFSTDVADFEAALRDAARSPEGRREALARAVDLYRGELLPGVYDDWVVEERERLAAAWEEAQERPGGDAPAAPAPAVPCATPAASPPPDAPRLPMLFTRFFGREQEQADLVALIGDESVRLVTLTGPGGTGKTRLALEAARQAAGMDGRVYFIPLADLTDARLIPDAVAEALGLPRTSAGEPMDRVVAALCAAPALLVLDNLEQLGESAAPPLLSLLTRLPSLTILATSRARLFIAGEREYPLSPLPTPCALDGRGGPPLSPERLLLFPGVQLFADRARATRPDFQITVRSAPSVAEVCRRLEGIPLALELAAAWSSLLTPAQMCERMDARLGERFTLLRSRGKGVAERHQTLWAAISWSYDLLPPDLARFWANLSVFRGGWTAEAAQEVCAEPRALDFLGRLRAYSLVTSEDAGDEMRFRLLETLREFGWARLDEAERCALAARHAAWFLRLAEQAEPLLTGPDQVRWLNRLGDDQDNLRGALDWDESEHGEAARGLRIAGALWRFWATRGPLSEGRRRLEQALERSGLGDDGGTIAQARALSGLAVLTRRQGDMAAAGDLQRRSLAIWRVVGDGRGIASSLNNLGALAALQGDYAQAEPLLLEAKSLWRELGKDGNVASTLTNLAFLERERGDFVAAEAFCAESLLLFHTLGDRRGTALSLSIRAEIAAEAGEYTRAQSLYRDVFEAAAEVGDVQTVSGGLAVLGRSALVRGLPEHAARLLGAGKRLNEAAGFHERSNAQVRADRAVEDGRRALPPPVFAAAWAEGQAMTAEQAVAYALEEPPAAGA